MTIESLTAAIEAMNDAQRMRVVEALFPFLQRIPWRLSAVQVDGKSCAEITGKLRGECVSIGVFPLDGGSDG